jgi:hypothetical protein
MLIRFRPESQRRRTSRRWPDEAAVPGPAAIRDHILERTINSVGIDTNHTDTLFDQPEGAVPPQGGLKYWVPV